MRAVRGKDSDSCLCISPPALTPRDPSSQRERGVSNSSSVSLIRIIPPGAQLLWLSCGDLGRGVTAGCHPYPLNSSQHLSSREHLPNGATALRWGWGGRWIRPEALRCRPSRGGLGLPTVARKLPSCSVNNRPRNGWRDDCLAVCSTPVNMPAWPARPTTPRWRWARRTASCISRCAIASLPHTADTITCIAARPPLCC